MPLTIAKMAQDCSIQMLTLHGRTRADGYRGERNTTPLRSQAVGEIPWWPMVM